MKYWQIFSFVFIHKSMFFLHLLKASTKDMAVLLEEKCVDIHGIFSKMTVKPGKKICGYFFF